VLILLILLVLKKQLVSLLLEPIVKHNLQNRTLHLEPGLNVVLIGTGSPLPDKNRAGSCVAVIAGDNFFVVDAGIASAKNIYRVGLDPKDIDGVLMTHFHSDHIGGLGEMMLQRWADGGHKDKLPIYGPKGVDTIVNGFNQVYQFDARYRVAEHGSEVIPESGAGGIPITFTLADSSNTATVIFEKDGLKITVFNVDHRPVNPAVGYKFEYKGKSIVISGDTKYTESVIQQAKNADVLIHEALNIKLVGLIEKYYPNNGSTIKHILHDIPDYHTTPVEVAQIAKKANVKNVVLYHIIPPLPSFILEEIFLEGCADIYAGPLIIGVDGLLIHLPLNSNKTEYKKLLK
ncbi:MAG: MBL fold metallo-hydrolase, partial [Sediminibacterium sp.]|nr:MBL fold metallo-hydrolase [Sediminibacterium sp.]